MGVLLATGVRRENFSMKPPVAAASDNNTH
jgi:hypothetical protein